jgi:hypothetical protein
MPEILPAAKWWAFRLFSRKPGNGWDVENIPKLIVDAFSDEQIQKDRSDYPRAIHDSTRAIPSNSFAWCKSPASPAANENQLSSRYTGPGDLATIALHNCGQTCKG